MIMEKERIGKMTEDLKSLIYRKKERISTYKIKKLETGLIDINLIKEVGWEDFNDKQIWGGDEEYFLFSTTIVIPEDFQGEKVVYRLKTGHEGGWDIINPQFRVYVNGVLKQGLDVNHREMVLSEKANAFEVFEILLVAYTSDNNYSILLESDLCVIDAPSYQLFYDLMVPYQVISLMDEKDKTYVDLLKILSETVNYIDLRKKYSEEYYLGVINAQEYLKRKLYESNEKNNADVSVLCVGHTHIDCAWLWTSAVTKDKVMRSFATVLDLMEKYPEYRFMSSQPLLYEYAKEYAPELYEKIREKVKEGRWEPEGGMYVEADCNLISGESLIRQFIYGQKFFREEFQRKSSILWLPDVFGYSSALPQIMKKCGIKYFMTTKLNWGEFNKFPYDVFEWEGIDGSKILSYLITASDFISKNNQPEGEQKFFTTYNGILNPSQIKGTWSRFGQKEVTDTVLMAFGYGDGGGGPTAEMLENQRRLAKNIPGCPKTVTGSAGEFFAGLKKDAESNKKYLPKWVGELYLETHRGTYTSMAIIKKWNRTCEFAAVNGEYYAMLKKLLLQKCYPYKELDRIWKLILKNQFHDIIPGSAIYEVYEETLKEYQEAFTALTALKENSIEEITKNINAPAGSYVIFNPNGFETDGVIEVNTEQGLECYRVKNIPSKGYKAYTTEELYPVERNVKVSIDRLENAFFLLELNEKGQISRLYDKRAQRELIKTGENANVIMSYEDRPYDYDAWNINCYYREKRWEVDNLHLIEIVEDKGYQACIKIVRKYFDSTIEQYIRMYSAVPKIDIKNVIDWKEEHILLKMLFPVDIHTQEAVFDIQYGNIKRNTHNNTMWDIAKFEVCAHKWVDISENDYGFSILNDCKYGCDVHDGVIGLTMLKSATYPNPHADKGMHEFTYTLYPHQGRWCEAGTVKEAYLLNNPYIVKEKITPAGILEREFSIVRGDSDNIIIEVVKKAESTQDMVIRLYEYHNSRTEITLDFFVPIEEIWECNMLEENEKKLVSSGNRVTMQVMPYEIKTLKIRLLEGQEGEV